MVEQNPAEAVAVAPADAAVEAPVVEKTGKTSSVSTTVWCAGKQAPREDLFKQAIANTRDAIPVAHYDVQCDVVGTKPKQVNNTAGTAWEVKVSYTPRVAAPAPVDLDAVIKEAQAGYGSTHPGDPDFLKDDDESA